MTIENKAPGANAPLIDRGDERLKHEAGIGGTVRAFIDRVRSGDLGSLPVVVGLAVIWTIFQTINPVFLSAPTSSIFCSTARPSASSRSASSAS